MALQVPFENPMTGDIKTVKIGWSWSLFFLSPVFGIPLFQRGLTAWGFLFLAFNGTAIISKFMASDTGDAVNGLVFLVALGLEIFLGVKGNELTAKNYLNEGWQFAEPESDLAKYATMKWGIFQPTRPRSVAPFERDVRF